MTNGTTGWARETSPSLELTVLHRVDQPFWPELADEYVLGNLTTWERVPSADTSIVMKGPLPATNEPCFAKQYLNRNRIEPLKDLLRPSRARRAMNGNETARAAGFHAPRALCVVEKRSLGRVVFNALFSEAIENAPPLRSWLTDPALGVAQNTAARRDFLRAFARELGRWHAAGLHHGDLRLGNVLCRREGGGFVFFWIDNERTRRHESIPFQVRVHNLMRINFEPVGISGADRMRAWKAYLETAGVPDHQRKRLLREVVRATMARRKRRGMV